MVQPSWHLKWIIWFSFPLSGIIMFCCLLSKYIRFLKVIVKYILCGIFNGKNSCLYTFILVEMEGCDCMFYQPNFLFHKIEDLIWWIGIKEPMCKFRIFLNSRSLLLDYSVMPAIYRILYSNFNIYVLKYVKGNNL